MNTGINELISTECKCATTYSGFILIIILIIVMMFLIYNRVKPKLTCYP